MATTAGPGPGMRPPGHRVDQLCHACGQFDKHPRHHVLTLNEDGGFLDQALHIDCCSLNGCPDGSCDRILTESNQQHGDLLVEFVKMREPEHIVNGEVVNTGGTPHKDVGTFQQSRSSSDSPEAVEQ
jgi:hypothetical protein